ncbi:MAG: GTP cyclohydrolase [bacterium]|nr:GTP cyclohydrolase [bacterium]
MAIPKNLDECFTELNNMLGPLAIDEIRNEKESSVRMFHYGLGTSIKNCWELWRTHSPLTQYFNQLGIYHADDMSDIILTSFWRYLNNKPINLEELIERYQRSWVKFDQNMASSEV